jgi:hypothetical protein
MNDNQNENNYSTSATVGQAINILKQYDPESKCAFFLNIKRGENDYRTIQIFPAGFDLKCELKEI